MTIERTTPTILRNEGRSYTVLPNDSIALILSEPGKAAGDAFAIWAYLLSKPADWDVREADIRRQFGLGEDRYLRGMRRLRDLGFLASLPMQGADGKMCGRLIICAATPKPRKTGVSVEPKPGKTETSENPTVGKTGCIQIKDINTNKEIKQRVNEGKNTAYHPSHRRESANHPIPLPDKTPADEFREYLDRKQMAAGE